MKIKGFAVLEFLVVISIVSFILIIVLTNFPKVRLQLDLIKISHKFAQDMRVAQEMAITGVSHKNSSGIEQEIDGYGIYVDLTNVGNKKYLMYADKKPGNQKYDNSDYVVEEVDFSLSDPGITIKDVKNTTQNNVSLNFSLSGMKTTITELSLGKNNVEFVFALESDDQHSKSVFINTSGLIETK